MTCQWEDYVILTFFFATILIYSKLWDFSQDENIMMKKNLHVVLFYHLISSCDYRISHSG